MDPRSMNPDFIFRWRAAIASDKGPSSPVTRHVLLTLSLHMDSAGGSCFPSVRRLSIETGLSRRVVMLHLQMANNAGWIKKSMRGISGQGWRRHCYTAATPCGVVTQSDQVNPKGGNAELPPIGEGGNGKEPPSGERGHFGDMKVVTQDDLSSSLRSSVYINTQKNVADELYRFYLEMIAPSRRSSKRAKLNILSHLKSHQAESLRQAVLNYRDTALKFDPQYRKDPANFFGKNEPYFVDYLPENFTRLPNQVPDQHHPREVDLESLYAN